MTRIDGNIRDGGGRREDILLTYSPSFHFLLFLSFLFFFSFSSSSSSSSSSFCNKFFFFAKILQNFKRINTK